MSQFYTGVKQTLLSWAVGPKPDGVAVRVRAVDNTYVFDAAHTKEQVSSNLFDAAVQPAVANGIVSIPDFTMNGLETGKTIKGLVIYFNWPTGSKLICFIDSAADMTLPTVIEDPSLQIKWNAAGVFKL